MVELMKQKPDIQAFIMLYEKISTSLINERHRYYNNISAAVSAFKKPIIKKILSVELLLIITYLHALIDHTWPPNKKVSKKCQERMVSIHLLL